MRKKVFIGLAVVIVLGGVGYGLYHRHTSNSVKPPNTINYGPQTKQEKKDTKAFKDAQQEAADTPVTPSTPGTVKAVTPVIAYADQYDNLIEVSAFVPGVIENEGTCNLKLTNGSATIIKTTTASKDATTTRCELFSFPRQELKQAGDWNATVNYTSSTASGTSTQTTFYVK